MCTKFPEKKSNGYMFQTNCSPIKHWYKKLGDGFNKKRGKNKHTCPIFENDFLASSKQIKQFPSYFIFQSNRGIYVITIPSVLCLVDIWLTTSLWIYLYIAQNKQRVQWRSIYFPESRIIQFTFTKKICRMFHGIIFLLKKDITFT